LLAARHPGRHAHRCAAQDRAEPGVDAHPVRGVRAIPPDFHRFDAPHPTASSRRGPAIPFGRWDANWWVVDTRGFNRLCNLSFSPIRR
jgi:hypothetical protein